MTEGRREGEGGPTTLDWLHYVPNFNKLSEANMFVPQFPNPPSHFLKYIYFLFRGLNVGLSQSPWSQGWLWSVELLCEAIFALRQKGSLG